MEASDLLSVMRHEIGHALGWTGAFDPNVNTLVEELMNGNTFDGLRLNIAMDPNQTNHSDPAHHPNDLMNPSIGTELRLGVSLYPAASLPARAFDHTISMRYLDASNWFFQDGSADHPWRFLAQAVSNRAARDPAPGHP